MGWLEFILAYAVFFISHSLPVRPPVRPWVQARLGQTGFTLAYSMLSLGVLGWLIGAAGRAPYVLLWDWAPWHVHVPLTVILPVCLILGLSIARPNPFSFGGAQNDRFDPMQPGIVRWSRHPLLLALALWAAAHVVPNGDLAHVILFGTFAAFALLGGRLIDRRKRREMGDRWQSLQAAVADAPIIPGRFAVLRVLAGLLLYIGLIWLHPVLFGVSPLP
ncbi:NnrU family protein [Yoonia vestfoldensis]|uniref:NnrU protein n=1 Tax=Yoonia vestfoldensis TaxID=245188 RepID=A0A1Y0E9Z3_9RHOB|nr:NnrU family protein [Yoonia vestfoldensis]ARU00435.1 NnrU protein [Yoonia vestfoldensis]